MIDTVIANIDGLLKRELESRLNYPNNQVFYLKTLSIPRDMVLPKPPSTMPCHCINLVEVSRQFSTNDCKKLENAGYTKDEIIIAKQSIQTLSDNRKKQSEIMKNHLSNEEWTRRFIEPSLWPLCLYTSEASAYIYQTDEIFFGLYIESLPSKTQLLTIVTYLTCCAKMIIRSLNFGKECNIYFNIEQMTDQFHLMFMIK